MFNLGSVTATNETLMHQAPMTVMEYVRTIKAEMGEEWVKANPQAFATLVQAAALDFHANVVSRDISRLTDAVNNVASNVSEFLQGG